MRWVALVASLALAGCASETDRAYADFKTCQARGFEPGSAAYRECRDGMDGERYAKRQAVAGALMAAGQALRDTTPPGAQSTIPSGFTKVCMYQTITGPRALAVSAVSLCPLLPPT